MIGYSGRQSKVDEDIGTKKTYKAEGVHVVSVCLLAKEFSGNLTVMEPDKCSGWQWCEPTALPQPHFEASSIAIACYLEKKFYRQG